MTITPGIGWLLIALAIYLISGPLPGGWLAQERGRSYVKWFVIGFCIGPLAILTVGLAPIVKADE